MNLDRNQIFKIYHVNVVADKNEAEKEKANEEKEEEPKEIPKKKLAKIIQLLLLKLSSTGSIATDFASRLITNKPLDLTVRDIRIKYFPENDPAPSLKSPSYTCGISHMKSLKLGDILTYLNSTELNRDIPEDADDIVQALNIILGYSMRCSANILTKGTKSSRNKYFPVSGSVVERSELGDGLQAFRGFFMRFRSATGRMLLNVQVQHIAAYEQKPLTQLLTEMQRDGKSVSNVEKLMKGLHISLTHLSNRRKKIAGFANARDGHKQTHPPIVPKYGGGVDDVQFYKNDAKKYIFVREYFKNAYNKDLTKSTFPLINVGSRSDPVYMPAKLCIVRTQDLQAKLTAEATAAMINFAVRPAPTNASTILSNGRRLIEQNSKGMLNSFGITYGESLIACPARILPGLQPVYPKPGLRRPAENSAWNLRGVRFNQAKKVPNWSFVWVTTPKKQGACQSLKDVQTCITKSRQTLSRYGIETPNPRGGKKVHINDDQSESDLIETAFKEFHDVKLLLVISPDSGSSIYSAVKIARDIKFDIHTVCMLGDNGKFGRALLPDEDNAQYFSNVAMKVNLKLGGRNHLLNDIDLQFLSKGKTMVMGIDVTHPAPGSAENTPSVSCVTASIDQFLSQWPADVRIQTSRQEIIEPLQAMVTSRLRLWQKHNEGVLPEKIIIYRDGVGEGMYELVRTQELPLIQAACDQVYQGGKSPCAPPHLTIILCAKRHHTRFYPINREDGDSKGATRPGIVVDRGVTESRVWHFYLQAHSAIKGTPKSAHYVVQHDEIFVRRAKAAKVNAEEKRTIQQRAADSVESLTHALCYTFGRATRAVSISPPAYYADLICDRARHHLSRVYDGSVVSGETVSEARDSEIQVHERLRDTMYYI